MIIVGKSMPIDNYEQYKRVINQITGRLYMQRERESTCCACVRACVRVGACVHADMRVSVCVRTCFRTCCSGGRIPIKRSSDIQIQVVAMLSVVVRRGEGVP